MSIGPQDYSDTNTCKHTSSGQRLLSDQRRLSTYLVHGF